ncbi:MAG: hypothetical protein DRH76_06860 [Deltaproteobacteria bacterium]|nr:MAG: hypothetical protein DRH76_06860 [Deltaproteobacteria bacterium]
MPGLLFEDDAAAPEQLAFFGLADKSLDPGGVVPHKLNQTQKPQLFCTASLLDLDSTWIDFPPA